MATKVTITGPVRNAGHIVAAGTQVVVTLVTGDGSRAVAWSPDGGIVDSLRLYTDASGALLNADGSAVQLWTNDAITGVSNTYYSFAVPGKLTHPWNVQFTSSDWGVTYAFGDPTRLVDTPTAPVATGATGLKGDKGDTGNTGAAGAAGYLGADIDTNKPSASGKADGLAWYSTDLGQILVTKSNAYVAAGPKVTDASGAEVVITRFGGTATTGTSQVISGSTGADITGATTTFTQPADGRPVGVSAFLPLNTVTCPTQLTVLLFASCDNSTWVQIGKSSKQSMPDSGLYDMNIFGRLPHPLITSSTAAPNTLTAGTTVYLKLTAMIAGAGTNVRGAFASSTAYAVNDGVSSGGKWYNCKLAYTSTATTPGSDSTHWTEADCTIYQAFPLSGFFGYIDTRIEVKRQ